MIVDITPARILLMGIVGIFDFDGRGVTGVNFPSVLGYLLKRNWITFVICDLKIAYVFGKMLKLVSPRSPGGYLHFNGIGRNPINSIDDFDKTSLWGRNAKEVMHKLN